MELTATESPSTIIRRLAAFTEVQFWLEEYAHGESIDALLFRMADGSADEVIERAYVILRRELGDLRTWGDGMNGAEVADTLIAIADKVDCQAMAVAA